MGREEPDLADHRGPATSHCESGLPAKREDGLQVRQLRGIRRHPDGHLTGMCCRTALQLPRNYVKCAFLLHKNDKPYNKDLFYY